MGWKFSLTYEDAYKAIAEQYEKQEILDQDEMEEILNTVTLSTGYTAKTTQNPAKFSHKFVKGRT